MKRQSGLSLVELMVALVLGLIVVAAVIELFISTRQLYRTQDVKARMQEDGRYALYHIGELLARAGYRGCNSLMTQKAADDEDFDSGETQGARAMQNLLTTDTDYFWSMEQPVFGHEATGHNTWEPAKPGDLNNAVSGSDILTIRTVGPEYIPILGQKNDYFEVGSDNGLDDCDPASDGDSCQNIVMVSNCDFATVFQVTNDPSNGEIHYADDTGLPGNKNEELIGVYGPESWVTTIASHSFYVRNNPDGVPSLYQKTLDNNAQAILEGVEQMQIQYGVDTNDDLSVDAYVDANQVEYWSDVVSVRINLVMVNLEDDGTDTNLALGDGGYVMNRVNDDDVGNIEAAPDDGRLRRVYTQTIMLKNRTS